MTDRSQQHTVQECVEGLLNNPLYRVLLKHLEARRVQRMEAAIKATEHVDVVRGRAQELFDLMRELRGRA